MGRNMSLSPTGKHITLMALIAADGSVLKSEIIITRKTIDTDLVFDWVKI
jgi:hypothetical protein